MSLWLVIAAVALITAAFKAAGPMLLQDREFPPRVEAVIDALSPALLAGLVVVPLLGQGWSDSDWTVLPGIVAAAVSWRLSAPDVVSVVVGVVVTAATRALVG